MKRIVLLFLVATGYTFAQDIHKVIPVNGEQREYLLHLPKNFVLTTRYPLVLVFHGGGGNATQAASFFGMNAIADTAGFIVVYPNGLNRGWNDGRKVRKHSHDDIGFIQQLVHQLIRDYPVKENHVFATGMSNGGFFSFALALHLSEQFKAIAPVCASIPRAIFDDYHPTKPISILLINGTSDPLVPYDGARVGGKWLNRGQCTSVDETITKFVSFDHCNGRAIQSNMPDRDPSDHCTATKFIYPCSNKNSVQQIKINGGGHTWPGGTQYLSKKIIGNVCRDFSASAEIWNFFRSIL